MREEVILVNEADDEIGVGEKLSVHREGRLHRAFSIFIFDREGRLLLQRRASTKYHSPALWSNTCCGHPRPGETTESAARRRLREEMNFDCDLRFVSRFIYRVEFNNQLIENECDHVFVGKFDGEPRPNREEVDEWKWMHLSELRSDLEQAPNLYTFWLRLALDELPPPQDRA